MATKDGLPFGGSDAFSGAGGDDAPSSFGSGAGSDNAPSSSGSEDFNPYGDAVPTSTEQMMEELGIDTRSSKDVRTTFPVMRKTPTDVLEPTDCKDIPIQQLGNIAFRCVSTGRQGGREFPIYGIENSFQRDPFHPLSGAKLYITVESTSPWVLRQVEVAYDSYMAKQQRLNQSHAPIFL